MTGYVPIVAMGAFNSPSVSPNRIPMKKHTLIALAATLALSGLSASAQTLLNASYDVAREFYKDYNAAFVAHYKKTTGKDVKIDQAHGGSSAQARAVNDGLDADVVTMNTTTDVDFLASTGIVAKDWNKRFAASADLMRRGAVDRAYVAAHVSGFAQVEGDTVSVLAEALDMSQLLAASKAKIELWENKMQKSPNCFGTPCKALPMKLNFRI